MEMFSFTKKVLIALLLAGLVMLVPGPGKLQASKNNLSVTSTTTPTTPTVTSTSTFTPTLHGRPVDIYFNERLVSWGDALPFIQSAPPYRTMVPIRFFSETIGAEVSWNQTEKEVTVKLDATFTYDHVAREVKLRVGSDQAQVTLGDKVKTVVLDASVYQETEYPWRTFAPLRFITEGLGGEVRWAGVGSPSLIFPKKILSQDEVCIVYFFPVREEDYLIVPGVRYGKYELRWSIEQMRQELPQLREVYSDETQSNYGYDWDKERYIGCMVKPGKGIIGIGEGLNWPRDEYGRPIMPTPTSVSKYKVVFDGTTVSVGQRIKVEDLTSIGGYTLHVTENRSVSGDFCGLFISGLGLAMETLPDRVTVGTITILLNSSP